MLKPILVSCEFGLCLAQFFKPFVIVFFNVGQAPAQFIRFTANKILFRAMGAFQIIGLGFQGLVQRLLVLFECQADMDFTGIMADLRVARAIGDGVFRLGAHHLATLLVIIAVFDLIHG
ncbi:hypothetical protein [Roseovarius tolerans]|uniref:hypothetical protein n=1 Tax=Roseovarius tolerans TaxID=74031 RepID=UPI0013649606|nr:hypothetical protein [Roseovarius tolerans]